MAPERRTDTVALPRQAATVVASVVTAVFLAVGGALFSSYLVVRDNSLIIATLQLRLDRLEGEASKGDRFTASDGEKLEQYQRDLRKDVERIEHACFEHRQEFGHNGASQQFISIRRDIERLEDECDDHHDD